MTQLVRFDECPYTENSWGSTKYDSVTTDNDTTVNFNFSGGWYPDSASSGRYLKTDKIDPGSGEVLGYYLDVVPNWGGLSWYSGASNEWGTCGTHGPQDCENAVDSRTNQKIFPNWAGYSSNRIDNPNFMWTQTATGCAGCLTGNRVLCTINRDMYPNSCPGFNSFSNGPSVVAKQPTSGKYNGFDTLSGYYANLNSTDYPRGKGKCFYPKDTIQSDTELTTLLNLKNQDKIEPKLADDLAAAYCYKTVTDSTCGENLNKNVINHCTKYKVDSYSQDAANKPCIKWRNSLIQNDANSKRTDGKSFLDSVAIGWCNDPNNKYTPLCDCIKKESINDAVASNPIRNFYDVLMKVSLETNKELIGVPPQCWYRPCQIGNTYAMELLNVSGECPATLNICNTVNVAKDGGAITDTSQFISCTIDENKKTEQTTTPPADTTAEKTSTSLFSKPYVYIPVVFTVLAVIIAIISKASTVSAISAATSIASSARPMAIAAPR